MMRPLAPGGLRPLRIWLCPRTALKSRRAGSPRDAAPFGKDQRRQLSLLHQPGCVFARRQHKKKSGRAWPDRPTPPPPGMNPREKFGVRTMGLAPQARFDAWQHAQRVRVIHGGCAEDAVASRRWTPCAPDDHEAERNSTAEPGYGTQSTDPPWAFCCGSVASRRPIASTQAHAQFRFGHQRQVPLSAHRSALCSLRFDLLSSHRKHADSFLHPARSRGAKSQAPS